MYQTIHEAIAVLGVFDKDHFSPRAFRWRGKRYMVQEVTLLSKAVNGGIAHRLYSVMSGGNVYRLDFEPMAEKWLLEEVWFDS